MRQERTEKGVDVPKKKNRHKLEYKPQETWYATHYRCRPNQPYGRRGIKSFLTVEQVEFLWNRDGAMNMKHPSIDRINTSGNYELNNCRFIELSDNKRRKNAGKGKIIQSRNGELLKIWSCAIRASEALGISKKALSECLRKRSKTSGGFEWEYYKENKNV